jgi:uncharacterized protein with HEPN domain
MDGRIQELSAAISQAQAHLQEAINVVGEKIIEKIESDKFEQFQSRIGNMEMLIQLNNTKELFSYALQLKESVDYARNRVNEGKYSWLIPYLTGLPLFALALRIQGEDTSKLDQQFANAVERWKQLTLDSVAENLFQVDVKIPWPLIHNVLNNTENSITELSEFCESKLVEYEDDEESEEEEQEEDPGFPLCPRGHGRTKLWIDKYRCYKCGWPAK